MSCELYAGVSTPIDAFIKYFLDVKPYHTKILEVLERYRFSEEVLISIPENLFTTITIANEPLCKPTGWGVDWDDECGFDALSCCDLFDCIGGYGLIYDNSDLLVTATIQSTDTTLDKIVVNGNLTYDKKVQINGILNSTTMTVEGDHTADFETNSVFLVVPKHTYIINELLADGFTLSGNRVSEFVTRANFIIYASSGNDGQYSTKTAVYDFSTDLTTIKLNELLPNPALGTAIIEINSGNKNNGVYQVDTVSFNGTNTVVIVKDSVKQFTILNDTTFGSVQFRTAFSYPRYLTLTAGIGIGVTDGSNGPDTDYKILQSTYNWGSDTTEVSFTRHLIDNFTGGTAKLYGYMFQAGFEGDPECSAPKPFNVHTIFSEYLKITISGLPATPSPTPSRAPTHTPTATMTRTPSATGTATPTVTPTVTPTPTLLGNTIVFTGFGAELPFTGGFSSTTEIYDPVTGLFSFGPVPNVERKRAGFTILSDGKIFTAGGYGSDGTTVLNNAEIYDQGSNTLTLASGTMVSRRLDSTANLLGNGTVLISGGSNQTPTVLNSSELFDPNTGNFTATTGSMGSVRTRHASITLANGKVLVVGGVNGSGTQLNSGEIYNPATGTWAAVSNTMSVARGNHPILVNVGSGKILIFAGTDSGSLVTELYSESGNSFSTTGNLHTARNAVAPIDLLTSGKALTVGGYGADLSTYNTGGETYDPGTGLWTATTGSMVMPRKRYSSLVMADGRVLITSGDNGTDIMAAEIYDPTAGTFTETADMNYGRNANIWAKLPDGKLLIAFGEFNDFGYTLTAETYNSTTNTFTATTGNGFKKRIFAVVGKLNSGKILIAGGQKNDGFYTDECELYTSGTGLLAATGKSLYKRAQAQGINLNNGKFLITGGTDSTFATIKKSELYDPTAGTFATTGDLNKERLAATLVMTSNGPLIAGGTDNSFVSLNTCELYNEGAGTWSFTSNTMTGVRNNHTATVMSDGKVLITGGVNNSFAVVDTAEIYDPATGTFTATTGNMTVARQQHQAILLSNGKVLIAGGTDNSFTSVDTAEIYDPATGTFTATTGNMTVARATFAAHSLTNGKVVLFGGTDGTDKLISGELFDPATSLFTATPDMVHARNFTMSAKL